MLKTTNYNFPIYERNDVLAVLTTYNNTIKAIDTAIHDAFTKAESGTTDLDLLKTEVESIGKRVDTLESEIETMSETLSSTVSTVSEQTEKIATMSADLINQNELVNAMNTDVTKLKSDVESLKTLYQGLEQNLNTLSKSQELKNSEYSSNIKDLATMASVCVPFRGTHNGVTSGSTTWLDVFTVDLSKLTNFTTTSFRNITLSLQFCKMLANEVKANLLVNIDFSTTTKTLTFVLADGSSFVLSVTFNEKDKTIVLRMTGTATADREPTQFTHDILTTLTWNKNNLSQ